MVEVKKASDLEGVVGIVLPGKNTRSPLILTSQGGESTVMCKLMDEELRCELKKKLESKELAAWGTCAGLILLAEKLTVEDPRVIPVCALRGSS